MKATLSFYGGVGSVTGANFLLAGERTKLLVDCGLVQGEKFALDLNKEPFAYDPASIDFLLVTHAHIDHVGRIPKLVRDGFHGKIISTAQTLDLSRLMLPDAFSVLRSELPHGEEPMYDEEDIAEAFSLWETREYHTPFQVGEFEVVMKDSGHILGSAMFEISPIKGSPPERLESFSRAGTAVLGRRGVTPSVLADSATSLGKEDTPSASPSAQGFGGTQSEDLGTSLIREDTTPASEDLGTPFTKGDRKRTIVFTGDLGNTPTPLLRPAETISDATYLVMESVYGDRNHEGGERRKERLAEVISASVARGGVLLIPCFSLEKTQVLLYEMDDLLAQGKIPKVPVFLDSPLAIKVTDVYRKYTSFFNEEAQTRLRKGDDIFSFPNLRITMDREASSEIVRTQSPKIIIAGSGMSAGGRILDHEKRYLGDPTNTILFIGYQAVGGLGRHIQEGVKDLTIKHESVKVRAHIETITGYSSHKDSEHLVEFASAGADSLENIFVVMGEPKSALFLAQRVHDYLGVHTYVPEMGESVEIEL